MQQYPYLELTADGIYWVVRSASLREGFFEVKCDLTEDEFKRNLPKKEDWRKRLYWQDMNWGGQKQSLAFDALCGKLLVEDKVVVAVQELAPLPVDCPKCRGSGEVIDRQTSLSSNCPECRGTGIKDFAVNKPSTDS